MLLRFVFNAISKYKKTIKLILNLLEIKQSYSRYEQLKYYKLQWIRLKFHFLFQLIYYNIRLKVPTIAKMGTLVMFNKTDKHLINITTQP